MSATTRRYRVTGMHCASSDAGAPSDSEVVAAVEVLGYRAERLG